MRLVPAGAAHTKRPPILGGLAVAPTQRLASIRKILIRTCQKYSLQIMRLKTIFTCAMVARWRLFMSKQRLLRVSILPLLTVLGAVLLVLYPAGYAAICNAPAVVGV